MHAFCGNLEDIKLLFSPCFEFHLKHLLKFKGSNEASCGT